MTLEQSASIATILASLAVIGSLIYVARQMRQNAAAMRANSRHAMVDTDLQVLANIVAHPSVFHSLYKKEPLSLDEMHRLDVYLIQLVRTREHQWFQYQEGLVDERTWKAYLKGLAGNLSLPRTRGWWAYARDRYFDEDFIKVIDDYLVKLPVDNGYRCVFELIQDEPQEAIV